MKTPVTSWLMSTINSKYLKLNTAQETWNALKTYRSPM